MSKKIVKQIKISKADYILAVKGNQALLQEAIEDDVRFEKICIFNIQTDIGHGRIESRCCSTYCNLMFIENSSQWVSLKLIIRIE